MAKIILFEAVSSLEGSKTLIKAPIDVDAVPRIGEHFTVGGVNYKVKLVVHNYHPNNVNIIGIVGDEV